MNKLLNSVALVLCSVIATTLQAETQISVSAANVPVNHSNGNKIFDGDNETFWGNLSADVGNEFTLVLSDIYDVTKIRYRDEHLRNLTIEVDGVIIKNNSWTTAANDFSEIVPDIISSGSEVKFTTTGSWLTPSEVEVFGTLTEVEQPIVVSSVEVSVNQSAKNNIIDSDTDSFWGNSNAGVGDEFTLVLNEPHTITSIKYKDQHFRNLTVYVDEQVILSDHWTDQTDDYSTIHVDTLVSGTEVKFATSGDWLTPKDVKLFGTSTLEGNQYYVSTEGDDALGIGTIDQPWKTVHKALFTIPFDDDSATLNIRQGTYQIPETMFFGELRGGANGEYFTVKGYENENVVIDGSLLTTEGSKMMTINDSEYVRIENLSFSNLTGSKSGIYISGASNNIELIGNKLYAMTWVDEPGENEDAPQPSDNLNPIAVIGNDAVISLSNITIKGNEIYDIVPGYSEGIKVVGNVNGFLIEGNDIRDIANIGIVAAGNYSWVVDDDGNVIPNNVNHARNGIIRNNIVSEAVSPIANSAGIYLDGAHDVLVEGNTSYNNSVGYSVGCEEPGTASGNILRNNTAYNNIDAGLVVGTVNSAASILNTIVESNIFQNNYTKGGYGGEITIQQVDGLILEDNFVESQTDIVVIVAQPAVNIEMDYNDYSSQSETSGSLVFDWGGITGTSYIGLDRFQESTCLDLHSSYEGGDEQANDLVLSQCSAL